MNEAQLQIIELAKNPLNYGKLDEADIVKVGKNLSCGDQVDIYIQLDGDKISKITHQSTGCSISVASASLLSKKLIGKTLDEIKDLTAEDIEKMIGIPLGPSRLKCALLPLDTIQQGINEYQGK